ncbi:hypothetical protein [Flavobacterium sp.]|jgi:hypothetical protein|uniref:hypothetical protein n=1 Tax=Flavobacterium sp. TaxID=239 RepID=UPI0037BFF537
MKKIILLIVLFLKVQSSFSKEKLIGTYKNEIGEKIILKSDNTFEYYWNFDLASSWSIGICRIESKKNIILEIIEVKDTVIIDESILLVLSNDTISNRISAIDDANNSISGGGQGRSQPPKKLLIKGKKLFTYSQSNKIINRKRKSIVDANMMVKPWFVKD